MRVEVLLVGATAPEPLPFHDLVETDLWDQLPTDLPELLALVPRADLYLQDEMQVAFHPTPTEILRHIDSPFAPEKDQGAPLSLAQAI